MGKGWRPRARGGWGSSRADQEAAEARGGWGSPASRVLSGQFAADKEKVTPLLQIPQYCNLDVYDMDGLGSVCPGVPLLLPQLRMWGHAPPPQGPRPSLGSTSLLRVHAPLTEIHVTPRFPRPPHWVPRPSSLLSFHAPLTGVHAPHLRVHTPLFWVQAWGPHPFSLEFQVWGLLSSFPFILQGSTITHSCGRVQTPMLTSLVTFFSWPHVPLPVLQLAVSFQPLAFSQTVTFHSLPDLSPEPYDPLASPCPTPDHLPGPLSPLNTMTPDSSPYDF